MTNANKIEVKKEIVRFEVGQTIDRGLVYTVVKRTAKTMTIEYQGMLGAMVQSRKKIYEDEKAEFICNGDYVLFYASDAIIDEGEEAQDTSLVKENTAEVKTEMQQLSFEEFILTVENTPDDFEDFTVKVYDENEDEPVNVDEEGLTPYFDDVKKAIKYAKSEYLRTGKNVLVEQLNARGTMTRYIDLPLYGIYKGEEMIYSKLEEVLRMIENQVEVEEKAVSSEAMEVAVLAEEKQAGVIHFEIGKLYRSDRGNVYRVVKRELTEYGDTILTVEEEDGRMRHRGFIHVIEGVETVKHLYYRCEVMTAKDRKYKPNDISVGHYLELIA